METEPRTLRLPCMLSVTQLYPTVRVGTDTGRRGPKGQRTFVYVGISVWCEDGGVPMKVVILRENYREWNEHEEKLRLWDAKNLCLLRTGSDARYTRCHPMPSSPKRGGTFSSWKWTWNVCMIPEPKYWVFCLR